jgi:hypothetical protein
MNIIKEAKRSVKMENIGYGLYDQLAKINKKNPKLSERLRKIGRDELNHGKIYRKYLEKHYGIKTSIGHWIFIGRVVAYIFALQPKRKYLKKLSLAENDAVLKFDKIFESKVLEGSPFLKCYKAIYKDEVNHSLVYGEFYNS